MTLIVRINKEANAEEASIGFSGEEIQLTDILNPDKDIEDDPWDDSSVMMAENDNHYQIDLPAPDLRPEDFTVEINGTILTVSAGQEEFEEDEEIKKDESCYSSGYSYNLLSRSFTLPQNSIPEQTSARFENGILTLTIPKSEERSLKA